MAQLTKTAPFFVIIEQNCDPNRFFCVKKNCKMYKNCYNVKKTICNTKEKHRENAHMSKYKDVTNKYLIALQEGDTEKFAQFFYEMRGTFARIALRFLFDKSHWEDVLSETYLKISKNIASFNRFKDGYNWILKIIENAAKDINTKESRYVSVDLIEKLYIPDDYDPFAEIEADLDLTYALKDLDKSYLYVAILHFRAGRTQAEIAKMMGISKPAVCQRIRIIKQACKKYKEN